MSEPPSDDGRRSRSDAASRLAAMLADTGDDIVLPDGPRGGSGERGPDDVPSAAAIAARPAPVQPRPDRPRRSRRSARPSSGAGAADEPTRLTAADPSADDDAIGGGGPPPSAAPAQPAARDARATPPARTRPVDPAAAPASTAPAASDGDDLHDGEELDEPWDWDEVVALAADAPGSGDVHPVADPADATDGAAAPDAPAQDAPAADAPAQVAAAAVAARHTADEGPPTAASASTPTPPSGSRRRSASAPAPTSTIAVPEVRLRRVTLRAVAFGAVFALLVAAVPALAWVGKERLLDSRGGTIQAAGTDAGAPGYRAQVIPTEVGLVLQRDDEGTVTSATLLALGAGEAGGTVLQIPLNTKVREQKFLFDRLSLVAANSSDELFAREVADLLNVRIPPENVVTIDDESLATLTAPIAPLAIDNPDPVITDDGEEIPAGPVELSADQVGPYLRASAGDEDELARLARNEMVWSAWLDAVAEAGVEQGVGQGFTDIGPFLRTLAAGEPVVETLNVTLPEESDQEEPPYVAADGFDDQILDAVPYPTSPGLGRRWELVLLNGASGDSEIPRDLMRQLIGQGAALTFLGNAEEMGEDGTLVEYSGSHWRDAAERAAFVLGEGVEVERMSEVRADQAGADLVITLGSSTLDRFDEGG